MGGFCRSDFEHKARGDARSRTPQKTLRGAACEREVGLAPREIELPNINKAHFDACIAGERAASGTSQG